jgi:hypothetical protein
MEKETSSEDTLILNKGDLIMNHYKEFWLNSWLDPTCIRIYIEKSVASLIHKGIIHISKNSPNDLQTITFLPYVVREVYISEYKSTEIGWR